MIISGVKKIKSITRTSSRLPKAPMLRIIFGVMYINRVEY
jgi:hypothetical protein